MELNKKAMYYVLDAILAGILIVGVLILIISNSDLETYESSSFIGEDLFNALSVLKVSELNHEFVEEHVENENIPDPDVSVLEQLGRFWALNLSDEAEELASIALSDVDLSKKIVLNIGGEQIYVNGSSRRDDISLSRRMVAGIDKGKPITGTSASAYLKRIRNKRTSSYHYFGGFIGQGNVSFFIDKVPADVYVDGVSRVDSIYLEGDFQGRFRLYINGGLCESSPGVSEFQVQGDLLFVDNWSLPHCAHLITGGRNDFDLVFTQSIEQSSVSGGFLRIDYRTDELQQAFSFGVDDYYFPEIHGIANLYDSFFIPGDLEEMEIYLHFETNQTAYISLGERVLLMNTDDEFDILNSVYHEKEDDVFKVWIDNNFLLNEANFDYEQLSTNTVPLRFAAYDVISEVFEGGDADVVVITDFSASMRHAVNAWDDRGIGVNDCETLYSSPRARKSHLARCLSADLVDVVMDFAGNRVWPVFFRNDDIYWYNNPLDGLAVRSYISSFGPQGGGDSCLSCAVNQAYDILSQYSDDERSKFVVLMSDGAPTHCADGSCLSTSTKYGSKECIGYCNTQGTCEGSDVVGCFPDDETCILAEQNTLFSAQRLVDDLNVTIFTVGFGLIDECDRAHELMLDVAMLGNGTYQHSSDTDELRLIYENISYEILTRIDQKNQTVSVQGDYAPSSIFGDSKIDFKYTPLTSQPSPGKISIVFEENLDSDSCTSSVNLYPGLEVVHAEITSYSGPHWTDLVIVNNETAFNLSDYYVPYVRLGDPFSVRLPVSLLKEGENIITIETGDSVEDRAGCSSFNKLVYTALLPSVTGRTDSLEFAEGCSWFVETIRGTVLGLNIPEDYSGDKVCLYDSSFNLGDYNSQDAYDVAMFNLLSQLDPDGSGRIIVDLDEADLEIQLTTIGSIPYMWGPSIAEIEVHS